MNWEARHFKYVKFYTECKSYQNSSKVCCGHREVYPKSSMEIHRT